MPIAEVETPYKDRPPGSASKLRTFHDGLRILKLILVLVKEERPLQFFSILSALMAVIAWCWRAGARDLPPDRAGAPAADGCAVHRSDAAGLPQPDLRPDPRHGDARPARDEAHAVSEYSCSGRHARTGDTGPANDPPPVFGRTDQVRHRRGNRARRHIAALYLWLDVSGLGLIHPASCRIWPPR